PDARPQQVYGSRKPLVPGPRSPFLLPQSALSKLRFHLRQQFLDRQLLQILGVKPFQFGAIENGVGAAYAFEREFFQQLAGAQELFVAAGRPPEQGQEVAKRLRQESLGAVHVDVGRAVALGKPRFVGSEDQRQVREDRHVGRQRPVQQNLFGCVRNVVGAAD